MEEKLYSILTMKCTNKTIAMKLKRINHNARNLCDCFFFQIFSIHLRGGHGGLRYCGIELFFKRYFENFEFNVRYCSIMSPAVCGFSRFWLTVFGKRRSFTILRYCSFGLCVYCISIFGRL